MEGTASRVYVATLAQVGQVLDLVAVKVSGKVQLFASDDGDLAALEQVLGDDGREASAQMATAIDDNRLWGELTHRKYEISN